MSAAEPPPAQHAAVAPAQQQGTLRVADHFPLVRPECREVAARFFHCFSTKGEGMSANDRDAAQRGLQFCILEQRDYDECTRASLAAAAQAKKKNNQSA